MTRTDTPINVEVAQDPVHGDWVMERKNVSRAKMRGKPLDADCYKAYASPHEYVTDTHDFTGCYGLVSEPDTPLEKCLGCNAFVHGAFDVKRVMGAIS